MSEYKLGQRANSLQSSNLNNLDIPTTTIMELPILEETREENSKLDNLLSKTLKPIRQSGGYIKKSVSLKGREMSSIIENKKQDEGDIT